MAVNTGQFSGVVVTDIGKVMISKSQSGQKLKFKKIVLGDGVLDEHTNYEDLTEVKHQVIECEIKEYKDLENGQFELTFSYDNRNLDKGFWHREIGVIASINDEEEELYAYAYAGNKASFMYDKTTPISIRTITITFVVGNAENITVITSNKAFMDREDVEGIVEAHNTDPNAHGGILASVDTKISEATAPVLAQLNSGLDKLESHNTDVLSHPAITAAIAAILGSDNWQDVPVATLKDIKNNLGFGGIVAQRLEQTGYVKFANGFTIQWGFVQNVGPDAYISFPISFDFSCFAVVGNDVEASSTRAIQALSFSDINNVNFRIHGCRIDGAYSGNWTKYIAVGQ